MNNVFIVTKPLQYFNATNIKTIGHRVLLIVNDFFDAKNVYLELKEKSSYWDEIFYFDIWTDAYKWVVKNKSSLKNLFIDGDHGFTKYLYLRNLDSKSIYVYEEGVGNYRENLNYENFSGKLKRFLYEKILGHNVYLGGYKHTNGIYLYDRERFANIHPYCRKKLLSFEHSFVEHLKRFDDKKMFLSSTTINFVENLQNKRVVLYLSSWSYDSRINGIINNYQGYKKILKLHPHIKEIGVYNYKYDFIIPGNNFIELVIKELLEKCEKVIIIHHGTSSIMYFTDDAKLKTIQI